MAWTNVKRVKLTELLQQFAKLYSKVVELKVKQQCLRAKQQGAMLKAAHTPLKPQENPK